MSDMRQPFRKWMENHPKHKYTDATITRYIRALDKAEEWLDITLNPPVLGVETYEEFIEVDKIIRHHPLYDEVNRNHGHGDLSAALSQYGMFIQSRDIILDWQPSLEQYDPGIDKEQWTELLNDGETFTENALFAIAALYNHGGTATCKQLELEYGKTSDFYRLTLGVHLASKVKRKLNLPYCETDGKQQVWPVVFQGKDATDEPGRYVWKIRPELYEALTEYNIEDYLRYERKELMSISVKESVQRIQLFIKSKGFSYENGLIENFYLSLIPLLASGNNRFNLDLAIEIARKSIEAYEPTNKLFDIYLVIYGMRAADKFRKLGIPFEEVIDEAYVLGNDESYSPQKKGKKERVQKIAKQYLDEAINQALEFIEDPDNVKEIIKKGADIAIVAIKTM